MAEVGARSGLRHVPQLSIEIAGEAVKSRLFPLSGVSRWDEWKVSFTPHGVGVETYLKHQSRFKKMEAATINASKKQVDDELLRLPEKFRS